MSEFIKNTEKCLVNLKCLLGKNEKMFRYCLDVCPNIHPDSQKYSHEELKEILINYCDVRTENSKKAFQKLQEFTASGNLVAARLVHRIEIERLEKH